MIIYENFQKTPCFHCFLDYFLIKSRASGRGCAQPPPPEPPINAFLIFLKFSRKIREIFKKYCSNRKIFIEMLKYCPKIVIFHWVFLKIFEIFSGVRGGLRPGPGTTHDCIIMIFPENLKTIVKIAKFSLKF